MRIVYVEDNIANVHLVKRVARMGKHEIINYIDGMDALNNFASDDPDLVLMDIQLAGELTGIEVVKKLRDKGFDAPIYAVTAYAMVGDRERCMEAGCTGYISKPIPIPELVQLFSQYDKPSTASETASSKEETVLPVNKVAEVKEDLTKTKTLLSAASIKSDEAKEAKEAKTEDATVAQEPAIVVNSKANEVMDELNQTKTLLSAATIKSDEHIEDATVAQKPSLVANTAAKDALDDVTETKTIKPPTSKDDESHPKEENIATVAEVDNDDTISLNKDKPAQIK